LLATLRSAATGANGGGRLLGVSTIGSLRMFVRPIAANREPRTGAFRYLALPRKSQPAEAAGSAFKCGKQPFLTRFHVAGLIA